MKKNKILSVLLSIAVLLMLAACGGGNKPADEAETTTAAEAVADETTPDEAAPSGEGEVIDVGNVKVYCPPGWLYVETPNADGEGVDPNNITLLKGADSPSDVFNAASVMIVYHGPDNPEPDIRSFYEDVEELEPFEVGGRTWDGFKGTSAGYKYALLVEEGKGIIQVNVLLENDNATISLDDEDFVAILESLEY